MYAIVKAGGHQEKVEVGDVILVNRLDAKKGDTVEFPVALVVDGDKVTVNAKDLANISVKAEVVNDEAKGPKISIMKYKNKTGVARRKGHRQQLTLVKITLSPDSRRVRVKDRKEQTWHIRRARPARATVAIQTRNTSV